MIGYIPTKKHLTHFLQKGAQNFWMFFLFIPVLFRFAKKVNEKKQQQKNVHPNFKRCGRHLKSYSGLDMSYDEVKNLHEARK